MQASLRDLSLARHDSQSFVICQRTLHKCHELIFGDLPQHTPSPYSSSNLPFQARFTRLKIKANAEPTLVGLGIVLTGAPGMPKLVEIMGEVAIEQGRADTDGQDIRNLRIHDDDIARDASVVINDDSADDDESTSGEPSPDNDASATTGKTITISQPSLLDNSAKKLMKAGLLSRRSTISASRTAPALPLHLQGLHRSKLSYDPLSQSDTKLNSHPTTPSQSSPSISSFHSPMRTSTFSAAESLLQKYDLSSQSHLLRSHYCRSEVRFCILNP
jgi:hypothetical protein